ncbi:MAG: type IX secretion system membrane protein PorP/SprF [Bacteroidia bacterium]|nr:type IX secretion system membrane protein PorP/SprF [Bacteroidia bacterium]MCX7652281.1 type IX secretion system membrane protein PorP/SprF [Bacteroidia bacterium]MDW8416543.1 type IX secretion system membrane protein PorP/SprF [Bacteroidia bacterium]
MKAYSLILGWCILCGRLAAQELLPIGLWSQPQALSPAMVGLIDGKARLSLTHQFRPPTGFTNFSTTWMGIEAPFQLGELPAGVGGLLLSDAAGGWRTIKAVLSFAYEAPLGSRARYDHLRGGLYAGFVNRSIQSTDLYFEDQFDGITFSRPTTETFDRTTLWHADMGLGVLYYRTQKVPGNVELVPFAGFSVARLNRPSIGILVQDAARLSLLWSIHGGARLFTRAPLQLVGSVLLNRSNQSSWIGGSLLAEFVIYEGGYWHTRPLGSVIAGGTLRARDQYALTAGFTLQKGLSFGLSYSLLTRRATTPTAFGGLQLMMHYQIGYSYRERGTVYPFPIF